MPDTVAQGPFIRQLRAMGLQGMADRHRVTGHAPACVCLIHGVTEAEILFAVMQPRIGGVAFGPPMLMVAAQVECWPWCGYYLDWRGGLTPGHNRD